jgi:hypothetical protein
MAATPPNSSVITLTPVTPPITVEVMSIIPVLDVRDNQTMHQVMFGQMVDVTPDLRTRLLTIRPIPPPPARIAINTLTINYKFNDLVPYTVGSKWDISVSASGELTMNRHEVR